MLEIMSDTLTNVRKALHVHVASDTPKNYIVLLLAQRICAICNLPLFVGPKVISNSRTKWVVNMSVVTCICSHVTNQSTILQCGF